jgi:endoribonuclease LACTB2
VNEAPAGKPRFRDSAAVVMIRGTGDALETFWVRRSDAVSVMPAFDAFVGGSVDPEDASIAIEGARDEAERLLRACAVREAFEETGVLLALDRPVDLTLLHAARSRLLAGETTFAALAEEHGWRFRAAELAPAGRWQTPVFASVRFDTLYFLARLPEGQEPSVHVSELASGEWIRPADALARYKRGEATFAAPIYYTLEALAGGEDGVIERLQQAPERAGQPVRRIELKWGVVLHPMRTKPLPPATHTNAYLVGERELVLIDPGSDAPEELEQLFALIDQLAAVGRRLKMIVVTHHHSDHRAGADAVRTRYRVPVVGHPDAAKHLRLDVALKDGEWIPLLPGEAGDWNLHVLHTPGHTRDGLCLLHRRTRSLFCGDLIPGGRGTVIIDPPDGDMAQYLASLSRLLEEPVEALFPAHGSPQGAAMKRTRALIDHRQKRERLVLAALKREPQELRALVERVYADTPPDLWPYAERSLLAHLLKLAAEGRAVRDGDRWREGVRA